ncbi:MAG: hypothetical protein WAU81_04060 [Candidatus Aminicenantales bacterium]
MHKKLTKTAAFIALFAFVFLFAPGLSVAKEKPFKFNVRTLIKKPAMWISSFWSIFDPGKDAPTAIAPDDSVVKIKPLTDSSSVKPSSGD